MNTRKFDHLEVVNARQKASGKFFCYFSTPIYCNTLVELLAHAEYNHDACKRTAANGRKGGMLAGSIMKHASDLRIHSLAILRRLDYLYPIQTIVEMEFTKEQYQAVKKQANRTYRMKT